MSPTYDHVIAERWADVARAFKVVTPVGVNYWLAKNITADTGHRLFITPNGPIARNEYGPGVMLIMYRKGATGPLDFKSRRLLYPLPIEQLVSSAYDLFAEAEDEYIMKGDASAAPPEGLMNA